MTSRKKPGVAFWAAVGLSAAVLYVLSFGPVVWLADRDLLPDTAGPVLHFTYRPLIYANMEAQWAVGHWIQWYAELWVR